MRFLTAGESHGPSLTAILEGMPAGVEVSLEGLQKEMARRRWCYGRGGRASIENENILITGGVHKGKTTGAPISVYIPNRDYENWVNRDVPIETPRPGHADLPGAAKYGFDECRPVAERSSARETAARVACGYFAKKLLEQAGIEVVSWVVSIGAVESSLPPLEERMSDPVLARTLAASAEWSPVRCPDPEATAAMLHEIDRARQDGDSLGGVFEVVGLYVPIGLGSYVHWDRRLDTRLAAAVMSIPSVKAVEIGEGFLLTQRRGSQVHDHILIKGGNVTRPTNRAGGIEGGVSNGEPVFIRAAVKPVPTLKQSLPSFNLRTQQASPAHFERSDTCVLGSVAVVAESMVALVLADAWLERHGGDRILGRCAAP